MKVAVEHHERKEPKRKGAPSSPERWEVIDVGDPNEPLVAVIYSRDMLELMEKSVTVVERDGEPVEES